MNGTRAADKPVRAEVASPSKRRSTSQLAGYAALLEDLKRRIRAAQVRAALSVNRELIDLYWHIGKSIVERQRMVGWGKSVADRLAADLQHEFPGISGFSPQNVRKMRAFYLAWTDQVKNCSQPVSELDGLDLPPYVAEIPWGHNTELVYKLRNPLERLWYAQQTIVHGWSRAVLVHQIESGLYRRQGQAVTNFQATLPPPESDLAEQVLKDPYNFDFLTLGSDAREREMESGLLVHLRQFLLELGTGFAFVGAQHHLEVGGDDFYIDMLFYHLRLRSYVVIDLKMEPFRPEFAGKMNFYLSAVDDLLRHRDDGPSIGLILCKAKNSLVAEYSLRDMGKPIGVAGYRLTESLPAELEGSLPTVEEIEAGLARSSGDGG